MPNELWHYLQSRTPTDLGRDVLDVLITYYIFYRVVLVLKGTRAMQILIGLALVFVLYVVAQVLRLNTVLTILTAVLSSAILIGVVVFQNDIRRGLMRMGARARLSSGQTLEGKLIDDVVEAAQILARHRTGAIITFEQEANLDEFVGSHQGHVVDAAVTPELLVSLFIPEAMNKLHDGAVIIRDLRIAKAGVFFPMPEGRVADESFGSRHRAAMGITEETDAVVVVVSEERGTISFCFNGNIIANLDGPRLRAALEGVFAPKRKRKKETAGFGRLRPLKKRADVPPSSRQPASQRVSALEAPPTSASRHSVVSVDPGRPLRDLPRQQDGATPRLPKNAQPLRKRPAKEGTVRDSDLGSPTATPNPLRERMSFLPSLPEGLASHDDGRGALTSASGHEYAADGEHRSETFPHAEELPPSRRLQPASSLEKPVPASVALSERALQAPEGEPDPTPTSKPGSALERQAGDIPASIEPRPLRHLTKPSATQSSLMPGSRHTAPQPRVGRQDSESVGTEEARKTTMSAEMVGGEPDRATLPTVLHRTTPVPEPQEVESVPGEQ